MCHWRICTLPKMWFGQKFSITKDFSFGSFKANSNDKANFRRQESSKTIWFYLFLAIINPKLHVKIHNNNKYSHSLFSRNISHRITDSQVDG